MNVTSVIEELLLMMFLISQIKLEIESIEVVDGFKNRIVIK